MNRKKPVSAFKTLKIFLFLILLSVSIKNSQFSILNSQFSIPNLLFAIIGCSPSVKTEERKEDKIEKYLSADLAYSKATDLFFRIPEGWFTAEDNECKCIDVWIIKNDFSASLNLVELKTNINLSGKKSAELLPLIIKQSKDEKKKKLSNSFKQIGEDEDFATSLFEASAYKYLSEDNLPIRVIVFVYDGKAFEFSAVPSPKIGSGSVNTDELFRIQDSVLNSVDY